MKKEKLKVKNGEDNEEHLSSCPLPTTTSRGEGGGCAADCIGRVESAPAGESVRVSVLSLKKNEDEYDWEGKWPVVPLDFTRPAGAG
jgi:hypothetical protein